MTDYYLAGNCALECESYTEAKECFLLALKEGRMRGKFEFDAASSFYLAFSCNALGEKQEALAHINNALATDSSISMPTPGNGKMLSAKDLKIQIEGGGSPPGTPRRGSA